MGDDLPLRILEIEVFPGRKREGSVKIGGTVFPGSERDKAGIRGQKVGGKDKTVFSLTVRQTPAGEIQVRSGIVAELDPVGKIPLLILHDGMILDHYFGNDEVSGVAVRHRHTVGRGRDRQTETEEAYRDRGKHSAQKTVNSFQQSHTPECNHNQFQAYKTIYYSAGKGFCPS